MAYVSISMFPKYDICNYGLGFLFLNQCIEWHKLVEIFAAMAMDALADAAAKASCAYDLFSQVTGPILRFGSLEQVGAETILS